ncbi:MAG: hypothetical protein R3C44_17875 [Chloroflexota bacterium]
MSLNIHQETAQGLVCPNCSGVVPVTEGTRIVKCPYCGTHSLIQGDRGILRWQIDHKVDRNGAEKVWRDYLSGMRKASDLRQSAQISEIILVYLPFWRVEATVAGWLFGRVRSSEDSTKPAEFSIFERMRWNEAALDVGDLAIHQVKMDRLDLKPMDSERLHAEAMVFDPIDSSTDALARAQQYFMQQTERKAKQKTTYYRNIQFLDPVMGLAYYPVWIVHYTYRQRTYQVVIDGVSAKVISGNAPGNTTYRAAVLVSALAAGTFVLVNGSILVVTSGISEDGCGLLFIPVIVGLFIILWGYRNFRYGEEVEDRRREYQQLGSTAAKGLFGSIMSEDDFGKLVNSGKATLDELTEAYQQKADEE